MKTPHRHAPLPIECAGVAVAGVVLALAANLISPRGLSLTRDYFAVTTPATPARATATPGVSATSPAAAVRRVNLAAVRRLHGDPRRLQERVVFIDARPAPRYADAHIPGAYQFDHYHPEATVATVLAAATIADEVVIYCTGGSCEDSELAAADLLALGVPADKLAIYRGGISEWQAAHGPLEAGERNSGRVP